MGGVDALCDILLGVVVAVDDLILGGCHKVFGYRGLVIILKILTIVFHLSCAFGIVLVILWAEELGVSLEWFVDVILIVSFGDALVNYLTVVGVINVVL